MKELQKLLAILAKRGWATATEKSKVQALYKELGEEEKEEVKEDVEATSDMPETDPATGEEGKEGEETEEEGKEDEAVKSVVKQLKSHIDSKIGKAMEQIDKTVKNFQKTLAKTEGGQFNIEPEKYAEFAKALKAEKKSSVVFEIKDFDFRAKSSPGDMSNADSVGGELPQAELDPIPSRAPQRQPFIEQLINVGTISSDLDAWIETTNEDGDPAPVAELAAIPQKDWDFARRTAEVKKIGTFAKYSREMAEDLPNLITEVRNFLVADLRRVIDTEILSGNASGEHLSGIIHTATAYAAGSFAGTIDDANRFDVIETAVAQILTALHTPDYVILHPTDRAKLRLSKDSEGRYVLPPFIMSDGSVLSGVRVITNTGITAGKFLVGDFTKSVVKYRRGLIVEMTNTDQDDFIKDRFTVKATARLVHRVRENDYEAFVYGDFSTALTALDSGS